MSKAKVRDHTTEQSQFLERQELDPINEGVMRRRAQRLADRETPVGAATKRAESPKQDQM